MSVAAGCDPVTWATRKAFMSAQTVVKICTSVRTLLAMAYGQGSTPSMLDYLMRNTNPPSVQDSRTVSIGD